MAHKLEENGKDGKVSFFAADGQPAWHGLGKVLQNPLTAAQAIEQANLGFTVEKVPSQYTFNGTLFTQKDKYTVLRTDTGFGLGTVGKDYQPLQNIEAFDFFNPLIEEGEAIFHTGGVLEGGRRIWILAKFPKNITINGDEIEQYCLIYNSHDGSSGAVALLTNTRVVCWNTLNAAVAGATNKVTIRHTKNIVENLKNAHKILGLHNEYQSVMTEVYDLLANKQANTEFTEKFFEMLWPRKEETKGTTNGDRIREAVLESYETSPGSDLKSAHGTAFGLYNAVTHYLDHTRTYKTADNRMNSVYFGSGARIDNKALNALVELSRN